jgi:hypothetical protein
VKLDIPWAPGTIRAPPLAGDDVEPGLVPDRFTRDTAHDTPLYESSYEFYRSVLSFSTIYYLVTTFT